MKQILPLVLLMIATSPALAAGGGQSDSASSASAKALDLSLPNQPTYSYAPTDPRGDASGVPETRSTMPAGSYPYDPAKRFAAPTNTLERVDTCDGKPHGSATVGVGYSNRFGNSNFQAAQLNTCKRYYNNEGNAHDVGVSISIGQGSSGPGRARRSW
ncbi:hypothetical protein [Solilutibacter silvestris]|uniref:Uncharacterized protein n=1 Tax=Solilutibacter silvestris TaxID=1645665 RepID=A0A2K1PZV4_9GAMM|nr:hypothetical protein [Lysobacter silvestris]PNS08319.1 hypothetical protein Lysil_2495 [Lysobacter silvestris]